MNRRHFIAGTAILPFGLSACNAPQHSRSSDPVSSALSKLESVSGGQLGVAILDGDNDHIAGNRMDERFGMCSTFKLALAAIILMEADAGRLSLDTWVPYGKGDMQSYAPVTRANLLKGGMTIGELAKGTQQTSDNTAANLLLKIIGGPPVFTAKLRKMGDDVTRLDRDEPMMNLVLPGDPRDTTTPRAMAGLMQAIFTGDILTVKSKNILKEWAIGTRTGMKRLRAGIPNASQKGWAIGDKTGTGLAPAASGMVNKHNDIAIIWRDGKMPLFISAYYSADAHYDRPRPRDDAVLASVGAIISQYYN